MDLVAIIINYRTPELTGRVLTALLPELAKAGTFHVYLIDNASGDGSVEALRAQAETDRWGERVTVVAAPRNGGYGYGINFGVKLALATATPPDYFYVLNSDAFADPGSVKTLVEFMNAHPEAGMCGSNICGPDGSSQGAAFRFPSAASELNDTAMTGLVSRLVSNRSAALPRPSELTEVDWISGTCMIIRRAVFEQVGGFDEGFFLYFEEVDFAQRTHRAGWKSYCLPAATVTHIGSVSTGMGDPSRSMPRYWFESRNRYFIKHHGRSYAALCGAAWVTGYLVGQTKRMVLRKPRNTPPGILGAFLRTSLDHLTNPRLPGPEPSLPDAKAPSPLPPAVEADTRPVSAVPTLELLAEDFVTYDRDLFEPGLWAVVAHRLASRAAKTRTLPVRMGLQAAYKVMFTGIDWVWGINLPPTVELGRRVRLWHNGCMLLNARSIGNDVHIRHDTTFGPVRGSQLGPDSLPVIEDRADLGSGACVLGGVRVGHDAVVGANSVVLKSVAPHAVVLGVPARMVPT